MAAFTRHIGRVPNTGARIVVVFRQLPDEPDQALIVYSDALTDRYHDDLMAALESPNAQTGPDLFPFLQRQRFSDGIPMLDALHGKKLLHKTPTSLIKMTPAQGMVIQLDKLNEEVGAIDWGTLEQPDTGQVVDTNAIQPGDKAPASATAAGETALSDADLAASNLQQATSLEEEAKRLRDEAYEYDPDLKPKRGRPKKTS